VGPGERPQIRKSNIVCAEPMPGDRAMLEEFLTTLDQGHLERLLRRALNLPPGKRLRVTPAMAGALADLVRVIWDEMELAGEAGSLLKVEETLREAVAAAREASAGQNPLFTALDYDLGMGDLDFWDHAEELVLAALQDYAEGAANGATYRRRLFAGDAAQGFAFIQLCRQCYDVVLMNPPFGLATPIVFEKLRQESVDTYVELYASFVKRGQELTPRGSVGAITSRGFFTMVRLDQWRLEQFISAVVYVCDLGLEIMDDAFVRSAAYVLFANASNTYKEILILDGSDDENKPTLCASESWISTKLLKERKLFVRARPLFQSIPQSKFLYKADPELISLFATCPNFEGNGGEVRTGLTTFDDFRFLRLTWEAQNSEIGKDARWHYFSKGGEYAKFYTDIHLVVNRKDDGEELAEVNKRKNGQVAQSRQGSTYYYRSGLTFTSRSGLGISIRALPSGCVISHNAPTIYAIHPVTNLYLLGWINSRLIKALIEIQASADYFTPGSVKIVPWKPPSDLSMKLVEQLTILLTEKYAMNNRHDERSPLFVGICKSLSIKSAWEHQKSDYSQRIQDIENLQVRISDAIDSIYGINTSSIARDILGKDPDIDIPIELNDVFTLAKDTLIYVAGCCFGRWDIRYATGERTPPPLPDPFAPLPACPPGMLQNAQGLPAALEDVPADYPLRISWGGVLVDDPGHPEDIVGRVREALAVIWGERSEAIEAEACDILGVRSLRQYFRKPALFFADHLKRYSKSRRYAPIYWPLSTVSGSYTLWLYYHRLTDQTLYTCVNDFVDPKLKQVAEDLSRLRQKRQRSRDEEAELERLTDFEAELKDFREELLRVAAFWKPNLNDGVQITAAPLWRLFRLKKWQDRLKDTWEKLEAGEYDWAHLAYNIWPERVREKCKTDKSLAIAHDLEHLYVEPPEKKRKSKRRKKKAGQEEML
jgi:hypothetical protein